MLLDINVPEPFGKLGSPSSPSRNRLRGQSSRKGEPVAGHMHLGVGGKTDGTGQDTQQHLTLNTQLLVGNKNGNRPIKLVCVLSGQYRVVPIVGDFSIFRGT